MLNYLLESAFCLAVLYLVYHLALRRETFFQWNRAYLLLAPVFSFGVPALHVELLREVDPQVPAPAADVLPVLVERVQAGPRHVLDTMSTPLWSFTAGDLLTFIYLAVAGVLAVRLLIQVVHLARFLMLQSRTFAHLADDSAATPVASFFGFVIWQSRPETDTARRLMWQHEQVHVRQWHSLDVLLIEALIVIQWFNPLLYLYRRSLREVHEFLADAAVVRQCGSRRTYAELLVEQSRKPRQSAAALATTFHSLLKPRLKMLAKRPSRPWRRVKFLLALPLAAALTLLFSFRLVEKLPAAAPVREAVREVGLYTARLAELTVVAPKAAAQPTPYRLYWGALIITIEHWPATDRWTGATDASPELLREIVKREPRLYNGQGLEQHTGFALNGLAVRSDYNDPSVYAAGRAALDELLNNLAANDRLEISGLRLPNGKTAELAITLDAPPPNWLPSRQAEFNAQQYPSFQTLATEGNSVFWGSYADVPEREFITAGELMQIIARDPYRIDAGGQRHTIEKFYLYVVGWSGEPLVRWHDPRTAVAGETAVYTLDRLRSKLESVADGLKPGAIVRIDTKTAPSRWEKDSTVLYDYTLDLLSVRLVAEGDPRTALRRSERRDYSLQWGNFTPLLPRLYGRAFTQGNITIPADSELEQTVFNLTKREILEMARLPLRVFREKQPLTPVRFAIAYRGISYSSIDARMPPELVRRLESDLQAHDLLTLRLTEAGDASLLGRTFKFDVLPEDPKPLLRPPGPPVAPAQLALSVTPNPGAGPFVLRTEIPAATQAVITMLTAEGRVLQRFERALPAGVSAVGLPADPSGYKGTVVVRLESAAGNGVVKLVVE